MKFVQLGKSELKFKDPATAILYSATLPRILAFDSKADAEAAKAPLTMEYWNELNIPAYFEITSAGELAERLGATK